MADIDVAIFEFISKLKTVEFEPAQDHLGLEGNDPVISFDEAKTLESNKLTQTMAQLYLNT